MPKSPAHFEIPKNVETASDPQCCENNEVSLTIGNVLRSGTCNDNEQRKHINDIASLFNGYPRQRPKPAPLNNSQHAAINLARTMRTTSLQPLQQRAAHRAVGCIGVHRPVAFMAIYSLAHSRHNVVAFSSVETFLLPSRLKNTSCWQNSMATCSIMLICCVTFILFVLDEQATFHDGLMLLCSNRSAGACPSTDVPLYGAQPGVQIMTPHVETKCTNLCTCS